MGSQLEPIWTKSAFKSFRRWRGGVQWYTRLDRDAASRSTIGVRYEEAGRGESGCVRKSVKEGQGESKDLDRG
jgi:hypothetical protein